MVTGSRSSPPPSSPPGALADSAHGALSAQPTLSQVSQLPPFAQATGPAAARGKSPSGFSRHLPRAHLTGGVFKARLVLGLLMAAAFTGLLWWLQNTIARAWSAQLWWWLRSLDLVVAPSFAPALLPARHLLALPVPALDLMPPDMGLPGLLVHALAALVVWVVAGWWPERARPLALWVRCAALLHGLAVFYFFFWPASFAHSVADHVFSVLRLGWWLLLLTPWLHVLIYHLFPFALWQRLGLTALSLLYLLLATPLQAASHAALLHLLGPVAMPLLHVMLGVIWPVMSLVALYAWAMSWGADSPGRSGADGVGANGVGANGSGADGAGRAGAPSTAMPTLSQSLPPRL
jgi:hypothetical protein